MKKAFFNIYRCIVGSECGLAGEGNEQWYYSLALAINLMLIWWLKPEVGLLFTILAVVHYVTIFIYGYFDYSTDSGAKSAYIYLGIHFILLAIALFTSFPWTIITIAITIVALLLAPDCTGNNIFLRKSDSKLPLLFNTIIFIAFVAVDFLLPIKLWIKLSILIGALVIHPVIDYLEGKCVNISDVTCEIFQALKKA